MVITEITVKSRVKSAKQSHKVNVKTHNKEEHYHEQDYKSLVMIMIGCDNLMSSYSMLLSWTLLTSASTLRDENQQRTNVQMTKTKGKDKS